ncbi:hypothetical protein M885DRAFT_526059 [Pelagophyceae sp. CCMP2097]|nr:hypothetical protein M885DRAFT_526059 [Pelagophyceae sp. CCMP2097]|mmetsp:Transcript_17120/g.59544  ORF Transcript_17120/g.59544 Transcript_17120/m.59544 type:complete len:759 (+) Transcript_17120:119-2395(+)
MGAGVSFGGGGETVKVEGTYEAASDAFVTIAVLPVLPGAELQGVTFAGRWGDQGYGNQKGRLRIVVLLQGAEVAVADVEGVAPHDGAAFSVEIDAASCAGGDRVEVRCVVGGGGGHALKVQGAQLSLAVAASAEEAPVGVAALQGVARDWLETGDAAALARLPPTFSVRDVTEAFGREVLALMTSTNSLQDADAQSFAKATLAKSVMRSLKFFQWVVATYGSKTFFQGTYGTIAEEASTTTDAIVGMLVHEFTQLVDCDSPEVIRKIVALDHLGGSAAQHKLNRLDLGRIGDQREVEREAATLVFQMWADTKHHGGWADPDPFMPSSLKHARVCRAALKAEKHTDVIATKERDAAVFQALRTWIADAAGLAGGAAALKVRDEANLVNYKPLQSLFNKAYVRRGQMSSACIAGDIRRTTFTVSTVDELDLIAAALSDAFEANYAKHVDQFVGTAADQLQAISEMVPLELPGGHVITIYRFKANSSQAGAANCELYNMNFFIGAPNYYQAGLAAAYICACEVQLGVAALVTALRRDHAPYERQRILDALPVLEAYKEGRCGADCDAAVDYDAVQRGLFRRAFPRVDPARIEHISHELESTLSFTSHGAQHIDTAQHEVINDANFRAWCGGQNLVCWEHEVDANAVQNVEQLFVRITDQGWGNEGLLVALAMMMGPYVVTLASRGFNREERTTFREQGGIYLVAEDGYNFSGFSDKTIIPKGVSKLLVIATGRLDGAGHGVKYSGLTARISTLLDTDVERV